MSRLRKPGKPSTDYEVGYGRPPVATRFAPGRSGNPGGRPKGVKNVGALLQQALTSRVTVQENGRQRRLTMQEIIIRGLVNDAARRDLKAVRALFALLDRHQVSPDVAPSATAMQAEDRAILDAYVAQHLPQATVAEPAEAAPAADPSAGVDAGEQGAGGQP